MCLCDVCCSASIECHLCYPGTVFLFFLFLFALSTCFVFLLFAVVSPLVHRRRRRRRVWSNWTSSRSSSTPQFSPFVRHSGHRHLHLWIALSSRFQADQFDLSHSTQHCRTRHFNYVDRRRRRRSGPLGAGNALCVTYYYYANNNNNYDNTLHSTTSLITTTRSVIDCTIAIAVGLNFTLLPHSALFGLVCWAFLLFLSLWSGWKRDFLNWQL